MSYFQVSKRNIFSIKFLMITALALVLAFIFSGAAVYAGPPKNDEAVKPDKKIEQAAGEVDKQINLIDANAQSAADNKLDTPKTTTGDASVEMPVEMPVETLDETLVDPLPQPAAPEDVMDVAPMDVAAPDAETVRYNCYPQNSGVTECLCQGEEACAALKAAEICEPGTQWGQDDMEGCTAKKE